MSSDERQARRKAERAEERKRAEEIEKMLEAPRLPSFDKPATGEIIERPRAPPPKKK